MPLPKDIDGLSRAELKSLVLRLLEKVAELERMVAAQRDEIARLKGGPPRPNIKPSGMEQASNPKPPGSSNERRRGSTRSKLSIDEVRNVKLTAPPGARFKGYTSFVVQDLVIRRHVVNFRCVYCGPVLRHPAESLPAVDLGGRVWLGGRSCKGWPAAPAFGG